MDKFLALAERIERATFPCETDAEAEEVASIQAELCQLITGTPWDAYSPNYISSLDAALSLVPEGWRRSHLYEAEPVNRSARGWLEYATLQHRNGGHHVISTAATPALALCAAALRARANAG